MSSTTTIRLQPDLKKRVARLAKKSGQSSHNYMLGLIRDGLEVEERRAAFDDEVEASAAEFDRTRRGLPLDELKEWFARTALGERVPMPRARKLPLPRAK
jgi:predicted transcriptional regulator